MKKLVYLFIGIFLISCGVRSNDTIAEDAVSETTYAEDASDAVVPEETPTQRLKYNESEPILTDLVHTKLEVKFDWKKSYLYGIETLTVKPHFYPSDSLILKAKGMTINSVKLDGKDLSFDYKDDILKIKLGKTFTRKENYTVVIDYVAKPDERELGGSSAITSDKGLYFINPKGDEVGKMPQIWTQGETEASSVWFPTIDAPNSKTTQEIFMTVEQKYITLSNGKLIATKKNADGTRTDHWKQDLPHAPYLFMMAVGEFKVIKDQYMRINGTKMDVDYFVEPEWEQYADDIFGETPEMINYFSKLLGVEYAWDKYHQIVVREYVSGAMENTGAVIFGDFVYKTDRELLDENDRSTIAHELFHHWFGDYVTCESWSNLPLNESFANYSQYLWDEHRDGIEEADYQAEKEADGYYQSAQMQGYHDLIWFDFDEKEQMFDGHSYNKGGRILHMLRNHIGDEAFFESLKLYLTQNKFKAAEFHHLRLAFEEVTGQDLNWFFNQWFLGSGHPILDISETVSNNQVELKIVQKQNLELSPIFKLPMQVAVVDDAGKHIHSIVVDKLEQTFTFPVTGTLKCVIPDYQEMLLAKVREEKPQAEYIAQYYESNRYRTRSKALQYGTKKTDSISQKLVLDALNDPFWAIQLQAIEKAARLKAENKTTANEMILQLTKSSNNSQVRSAALSYLESANYAGLEPIYTSLIEKDSSYLVVSTALRSLAKTNPDLAMKKAELLEKEPSSKMLASIASLYGVYGDVSKFAFFKEVLSGNKLIGFDQLGTMNTFTMFVAKQEVQEWEDALPMYQNLAKNGGFYTKMFIPKTMEYLLNGISEIKGSLNQEFKSLSDANDIQGANEIQKMIARWDKLQIAFTNIKEEK